jgi:hypothetical protein
MFLSYTDIGQLSSELADVHSVRSRAGRLVNIAEIPGSVQ